MTKLPWYKMSPADWKKDPNLALCSLATRGFWIEAINSMHENGQTGQLRGTPEQLARLIRCQPAEVLASIAELEATKTADVTHRNGLVTVENRKMRREHKVREQTRKRVSEHRRNAPVTPYVRAHASDLSLSQKEERRDKKLKSDKGGEKALAKLNESQKQLAGDFERALGDQWTNDAGKWINRIKANWGKCTRVIAELSNAIREERVKTTPAQYAEQIWKEFA